MNHSDTINTLLKFEADVENIAYDIVANILKEEMQTRLDDLTTTHRSAWDYAYKRRIAKERKTAKAKLIVEAQERRAAAKKMKDTALEALKQLPITNRGVEVVPGTVWVHRERGTCYVFEKYVDEAQQFLSFKHGEYERTLHRNTFIKKWRPA